MNERNVSKKKEREADDYLKIIPYICSINNSKFLIFNL